MDRFERIFDRLPVLIAFLAAVLALALLRSCIGGAFARAADRWPVWTPESQLALGKCIRAESDKFRRDWPLLGWCLVKQWRAQPFGRTIDGQIRAHCAVFNKGADKFYANPARRRAIRASTWTAPIHGTVADWTELRVFVQRFTEGQIEDPCPRCKWWAGHPDAIPPHWTCPVGPVPGPKGRLLGNSFCHLQK